MNLKHRVALYGVTRERVLTFDEVVDNINCHRWLFLKVQNADEQGALFIRVPDDSTFRDVEMFARGIQTAKPRWDIERVDYK